ncbi:MAG: ANTAR domain-containing protein [Maricaulaceae bacterium]|jgi:response regulator NasT
MIAASWLGTSERDMRVLILDPDEARAALVAEGLELFSQGAGALGARETIETLRMTELDLKSLADFAPDAIVIACESPDRDTLEALRGANAGADRPIVMFVDRSEPGAAAEALEAGVAAYIVDGLSPQRIGPVLEVAKSRFALMQRLRADLDKAKADLAARKTIERAKGAIMKHQNVSEPEAYAVLRKLAMNSGRPISVVAEDVLAVVGLLKTERSS